MTMTRCAVLLRGINVGGRTRLTMSDLRSLLTDLGYSEVETYLQSGQAFLTTADDRARVEEAVAAALAERLGLTLDVMVRTHADLLAVVEANPFPAAAAAPTTLHAVLTDGAPDLARLPALAGDLGTEAYVVTEGVVYLHTPDGLGRSVLGGLDWRRAGVRATARNWRTLLVLVDRTA